MTDNNNDSHTLILDKLMDLHSKIGSQSAMINDLRESNLSRKQDFKDLSRDIKEIKDKFETGEGKIRENHDLASKAVKLSTANTQWRNANGKKILIVFSTISIVMTALINFIGAVLKWDKVVIFLKGLF